MTSQARSGGTAAVAARRCLLAYLFPIIEFSVKRFLYKDGSISISFFLFWLKFFPKKVPNHYPEDEKHKEKMLKIVMCRVSF